MLIVVTYYYIVHHSRSRPTHGVMVWRRPQFPAVAAAGSSTGRRCRHRQGWGAALSRHFPRVHLATPRARSQHNRFRHSVPRPPYSATSPSDPFLSSSSPAPTHIVFMSLITRKIWTFLGYFHSDPELDIIFIFIESYQDLHNKLNHISLRVFKTKSITLLFVYVFSGRLKPGNDSAEFFPPKHYNDVNC